jgi:hypothetical protein
VEEVVVAGSVVATGIVVAGWPVVGGDAVDVVGTVVVVAVLSGEDVLVLLCVRFLGLSVVVVAALVGVLEVARVGTGLVELGRVVVVLAEVSRAPTGLVVVVGGEVRSPDFFRSLLTLVVVVFGRLVVGAPVADLPPRYARLLDPCRGLGPCRLFREYDLAEVGRVVDVPGVVDVCVVVDTRVVGGASVGAAWRWLARAWPWRPRCSVDRVVVDPTTVVEVVGLGGAEVAGRGTLVPSETASAPSAVLMATTSLVPAIRWATKSSKKVSANWSNCSRCAPTLSGRAEPSRGLSSATSTRPACMVMSPWRTPSTTAHATVRASFSGRECP